MLLNLCPGREQSPLKFLKLIVHQWHPQFLKIQASWLKQVMATLTMHVEAGWLRLLLLLNLLHQKDLKPPGEESNYLWDLQMKQCLRADFDLQNLLTHPLRREKVLLLGKERVKAMESNITDLPKIGWGGQTERCACWQPGTGQTGGRCIA